MFNVSMTTSLRVLAVACVLSSITCIVARAPSGTTIVGVTFNGLGCPPQSGVVISPDGMSARILSPNGQPAADTGSVSGTGGVQLDQTCSITLQLVTAQRWRSTRILTDIQGQVVAQGMASAATGLSRVEATVQKSRQGRIGSIAQPVFPQQTFQNIGDINNFFVFGIYATDIDVVCIVARKCSGMRVSVTLDLTVRALADADGSGAFRTASIVVDEVIVGLIRDDFWV